MGCSCSWRLGMRINFIRGPYLSRASGMPLGVLLSGKWVCGLGGSRLVLMLLWNLLFCCGCFKKMHACFPEKINSYLILSLIRNGKKCRYHQNHWWYDDGSSNLTRIWIACFAWVLRYWRDPSRSFIYV